MLQKKHPLQRMVRKSAPVVLQFEDGQELAFNLAFDFNTLARIESKTGLKTLNIFTVWIEMSATVLSVMFWAAACTNHPEYDSDEGLAIIRSLMDRTMQTALQTRSGRLTCTSFHSTNEN